MPGRTKTTINLRRGERIAFGIIGLFIGPVVLAVAYPLLVDWVSESNPSDELGPPPTAGGMPHTGTMPLHP